MLFPKQTLRACFETSPRFLALLLSLGLLGGCELLSLVPLPAFSKTTNIVLMVEFYEFQVEDRYDAERLSLCFRFVAPEDRLDYDYSANPELAEFGNLGPRQLTAKVRSNFETEVFTFTLAGETGDPWIDVDVPLSELTDDEVGVRELGEVTFAATTYIYRYQDGLASDACERRTMLQ